MVWVRLVEILLLTFTSKIFSCNCLFISHIGGSGLKGNFTFQIDSDGNQTQLNINVIIEELKERVSSEDNHRIHLDWSLQSNSVDPSSGDVCSQNELGQTIPPEVLGLTEYKQIILNQQTSWTFPLDLKFSSSLSSLIWGKSILVKLSQTHQESKNEPPRPEAKNPLLKPKTLTSIATSSTSKPIFAPRPKPNILSKSINQASSANNSDIKDSIINNNSSLLEEKKPVAIVQDVRSSTNSVITKIYGNLRACGTIIDTGNVKTMEAIFESHVSGKVVMRGNEDGVTLISLNLYHLKSKIITKHDWKLLASDILDPQNHEEKCKHLHILFDPNYLDDSNCKQSETSKCKIGDLTKKHGQLQIAGQGRDTRTSLIDHNLPLSALETSRSIYIVIFEVASQTNLVSNGFVRSNILSCAEIKPVRPRAVEANFNSNGVKGSVKITQRYYSEPATIEYNLFGLEGNIKHLTIREIPLQTGRPDDRGLCSSIGDVFNPWQARPRGSNEPSIGNLSARHGYLQVIDSEYEDHYMGEFVDQVVNLFGSQTIVGRSLSIEKNNGDPWVCAILDHVDESVIYASAVFHYPVIGQILFQQLADGPNSETGVSIDVHNPNSEKSSDGHNWLVHVKPAMADFYNWSERCQSTGEVFDPLQASIGISNEAYVKQCSSSKLKEPLKCKAGDTGLKSNVKIFLPIDPKEKKRKFYSDPFLPLSGPNSIIGRSVVIYDDNSPAQRGNRLACATIKRIHPLRAIVKTWGSGPSIPSSVRGSVSFEQELTFKPTRIKFDLEGLSGNVQGYAVYDVWSSDDREFPCSNDSVFGMYDPYNEEGHLQIPPTFNFASTSTADRMKVGDLSRKHGSLEGLDSAKKSYIDFNCPLFAPNSIIGRSVVLRASVDDIRWVCGNIEFDYDRKNSREIVGLASFDEPRSKISGYVRFYQLEYPDGSVSDTVMQIDLKLQSDGIHEPETSHSHNWAIFVNQVGEDAFIAADDVRCIASGFRWNPYLAQDSLETYSQTCSPEQQLTCAMGDLGSRHGFLTLGPNNRRVVSDPNLPLVGNFSVMGRSLVIFDAKRPTIKLACTNILPDIHLKSNIVIKRTPSFTVARFVEQVGSALGVAEWLMVPDLKATRDVAGGECIQMTIHFYGRRAHQVQSELNNLINLGTVKKSTRIGSHDISIHYRSCRIGESPLTSCADCHSFSRFLFGLIYIKVLSIIWDSFTNVR